jgi:hypothetical protein
MTELLVKVPAFEYKGLVLTVESYGISTLKRIDI